MSVAIISPHLGQRLWRNSLARDRIYVAGGPSSFDLLRINAVQPTDGGFGDVFLTVLSWDGRF